LSSNFFINIALKLPFFECTILFASQHLASKKFQQYAVEEIDEVKEVQTGEITLRIIQSDPITPRFG
jgi:hypothetical protein